ncbi:unnamed protein product [Acanthosepion pharaonis]|uniref:Uncharacterized protein n=1 Tax=Acanthosepion pharaonis TaxID=158019 RepID=A0A812APA2_ACAPH|nr:unnamed protein product [Sepia pharaonis]
MDLSRKLNKATDENLKMKTVNNTLTKEVSTYKQMILTKDKALEESQINYTKCAKELNRLRTEFRQLEEQTLQLKMEMESCANTKDKEKIQIKELSAEIMNLVNKHKKADEDKLSFLHSVYQRLLAGLTVLFFFYPLLSVLQLMDHPQYLYNIDCSFFISIILIAISISIILIVPFFSRDRKIISFLYIISFLHFNNIDHFFSLFLIDRSFSSFISIILIISLYFLILISLFHNIDCPFFIFYNIDFFISINRSSLSSFPLIALLHFHNIDRRSLHFYNIDHPFFISIILIALLHFFISIILIILSLFL